MRPALLALLSTGALLAWAPQDGGIGGPVTGYVVDGRSHSIRAIEGIPGAARLGAAVDLPFAVADAVVSNVQDYALATAVNGDGQPILVRGLRSGAPATAAIDNAIAPSGMRISDSGAVAVLYTSAAGKLQWVTGLPSSPQAIDPIDIGALNGGVAALALASDGRSAVIVAGDGAVYRADRGGVTWLARVPGASSASLFATGDDAVVASGETGDVVLLRGLAGALTIRTVGGAFNGITSARAVRALGAQEVAVVDGDGRLMTIDTESGQMQAAPLAAAADRFETLDRTLLLLNRPGQHPLVLLDTAPGHATYFVPPDRSAGPERGVGSRKK